MDTLLLNADAQPVSYLPLSTITWQDSVRYMVLEKVRVLAWYEDWIIRSERWETQVPSVVMLTEYQKKKNHIRLSKRNVFLRDGFKCQYCGVQCSEHDASLDHVLPVSRGGKNSWTNLTTACRTCNSHKGSSTKWRPAVTPYRPDYWELSEKRRRLGYRLRHPSWSDFLAVD